jgi:uncharacterized protein (DUF58 family)
MAKQREDKLVDRKYVVFDVLNRIASLEMRARDLVEGTMAGLQRSPYLGASSEFAQHRAYVAGDDVRHIDWKVYGRTERYYVRQFQEETNFVVNFVLDCSESMRYGSGPTSKLDHACLLTASLSYLALRQSDAVSIALFDETLLSYLPPRTSLGSLGIVASNLETIRAERGTKLESVVPVLVEMLGRRGIVVVISDLLDVGSPQEADETAGILRAIQQLRHQRHEVIVMHVLDPQELTFDFGGRIRFEGMESLPTAIAEPNKIRADYVEIVQQFLSRTKMACAGTRSDYVLVNTAEPVDRLLIRYLTARTKIREGRR